MNAHEINVTYPFHFIIVGYFKSTNDTNLISLIGILILYCTRRDRDIFESSIVSKYLYTEIIDKFVSFFEMWWWWSSYIAEKLLGVVRLLKKYLEQLDYINQILLKLKASLFLLQINKLKWAAAHFSKLHFSMEDTFTYLGLHRSDAGAKGVYFIY